ncbi:MAG: hypothetical protein HY831_02675 [Candidatus Aenigmarchaeota archaeon]|nr:hypothetical protein [Candidatus Aenigmarchaeota archaeon]
MKKVFLVLAILSIIIVSGCIGQSNNYPVGISNSTAGKTYQAPETASSNPENTNIETSTKTYDKSVDNYQDNYQGFSLSKPNDWEVLSSSGVIIVRKNPDTTTAAIIYPVKLKKDLSNSEILEEYFNIIRNLVIDNGGKLDITEKNSNSASFSGVLDNQKLSGKIFVEKSGATAIYKMYWYTNIDDEPTLKNIINSYEKSIEMIKPLKVNRGSYFSIPSPENWKITETTNGIDAFDNDGLTGVSGAILVNAVGQTNPNDFIDFTLRSLNIENEELVSEGTYNSVQDNNGNEWYTKSKEFIYNYKGQKLRGIFSASVTNGYGYSFSAMMTLRQAPIEKWDEISPVLTQMESNFIILSASQTTAGVKLPSNHPADSSSIMSSWEYKNKVNDKVSNDWQETIMGYENTVSPSTGESYQMPFNSYSETGPEGPGYYRPLANGFTEKLNIE